MRSLSMVVTQSISLATYDIKVEISFKKRTERFCLPAKHQGYRPTDPSSIMVFHSFVASFDS